MINLSKFIQNQVKSFFLIAIFELKDPIANKVMKTHTNTRVAKSANTSVDLKAGNTVACYCDRYCAAQILDVDHNPKGKTEEVSRG